MDSKVDSLPLEDYGEPVKPSLIADIKKELGSLFTEAGNHLKQSKEQLVKMRVFSDEVLLTALHRFQKYNPNLFPGAQPISFLNKHMYELQRDRYLVCEKTDGMRFFLVKTTTGDYFLVDRSYKVLRVKVWLDKEGRGREIDKLVFDSIFDGELVRDSN